MVAAWRGQCVARVRLGDSGDRGRTRGCLAGRVEAIGRILAAAYGAISIFLAWLSFFLLSIALRPIPAGTAYAVWTGVGAAGGVVAGIVLFGEPRDATRLASLALIVAGIFGVQSGH